MLKNCIALVAFVLLFSCHQKDIKPNPEEQLKNQIQLWKKELVVNGEVGTPCQTDYMKWNTQNPESYYGLPSEISLKIFDANNDKTPDYLLYFPAGNACTGGHEEGSDFLKLRYSNCDEYLSNDKLRSKIETKIETIFYEKTNTDVQRVVFSIVDFNTVISGTYQLWTLEDPDCCASVEGKFKYNPFTFKIEITNQKIK
jgi:hypothetical protein